MLCYVILKEMRSLRTIEIVRIHDVAAIMLSHHVSLGGVMSGERIDTVTTMLLCVTDDTMCIVIGHVGMRPPATRIAHLSYIKLHNSTAQRSTQLMQISTKLWSHRWIGRKMRRIPPRYRFSVVSVRVIHESAVRERNIRFARHIIDMPLVPTVCTRPRSGVCPCRKN